MAILVEAKKTPVTIDLFVKSLIKVWYSMFEEYPKKESIGIIVAQWQLETGSGKSCWNYNLGNIKYVKKDGEDPNIKYHMLKGTWEIIGGKKVIFDPPHPASWFLAFDTAEDGMKHHLQFLAGKRWKLAWNAVLIGSPDEFAVKLKQQGYYTAPLEDYKKLVNLYFKAFMSKDIFEKMSEEITRDCYAIEPKTNNQIIPAPISMEVDLRELNENDEVKLFKVSFIDKILLFILKLFKRL